MDKVRGGECTIQASACCPSGRWRTDIYITVALGALHDSYPATGLLLIRRPSRVPLPFVG